MIKNNCLTDMNQRSIKEVLFWKKKRKALILAHNYQIPGIQDVADFVGDSLELSQRAAISKEQLIT